MAHKNRSWIENFEWLQRLPDTQKLTLVFVLSVTLVLVDFATGPFVSFPIAFAIPVAIAAWTLDRKFAVFLAITLPLIRFIFVWRMDVEQLPVVVNLANLVLRTSVLITIGMLVSVIATQNRLLQVRVNMLEGILPICSYCKRIRTSDGQWEQFETYITNRSEAEFSHGICQSCCKEHFPTVPLG